MGRRLIPSNAGAIRGGGVKPPKRIPATPKWTIVGQGGASMATLAAQGITAVLIELFWSDVEPTTEGTYVTAYFDVYRARIADAHANGMKVVLNYGLHETPSWFYALSGSRFVDQFGNTAATSQGPNFIWSTGLRTRGQTWTTRVFTEFAADPPDVVRIGGGHFGELTYPAKFSGANSYWAFDANALLSYPVGAWRPGDANTSGQVDAFLNWYLAALTAYQNWQIDSVRTAGYTGTIAVLYPDTGFTDADYPSLRTSTLNGTGTAIEINGEVQHGLHHARQIANLPTNKGQLAIWGTWATNLTTLQTLYPLAVAYGWPLMMENSGDDTGSTNFNNLVQRAIDYRAQYAMWVNYSNLPASFPT